MQVRRVQPSLLDGRMTIAMSTPTARELGPAVAALRSWQHDDGPLHLHPGDLGWHSLRGAARTAAAIRTWSHDGRILAVGLLDGPDLLRMAVDPDWRDTDVLARRIADDVNDPGRGVLGVGDATVEARGAGRLSQMLSDDGWQDDEPWTPFHLDLADPVEGIRHTVETVGPDRAGDWMAVHWSAFRGTPFTDEDRREVTDWWLTMATGPLHTEARSVMISNANGDAVAVAGVWSAGPGRPGLLEPMGVHRDHRGHGHGREITRAAASALREMGSSSAIVCAESSNVGAVSTYVASGFSAHPQVCDLRRVD